MVRPLFAAETRLARRLRKYRTAEVAVSDSVSAVDRTRFVTDIPPDRIDYLKRYWLFIKKYLAEKYRILARIDFERSVVGLDTMDKTVHADGLERVQQLLALMVSNVPFDFCVLSMHASVTVEFVRAGHMFKNDDTYYLRKHRLLTPDVRTLTYLELFTNCTVIFDKKTIILFGTKKGVEKVKEIVLNTLKGNYHPIKHLRKLKNRYVKKNKKPAIDNDDWVDFMSNFPKKSLVLLKF